MSAPHSKSNYVLYNPPWHGKTEWYLERQRHTQPQWFCETRAHTTLCNNGFPGDSVEPGFPVPGLLLVVPRDRSSHCLASCHTHMGMALCCGSCAGCSMPFSNLNHSLEQPFSSTLQCPAAGVGYVCSGTQDTVSSGKNQELLKSFTSPLGGRHPQPSSFRSGEHLAASTPIIP